MGVWSSISFCNLGTKSTTEEYPGSIRNINGRRILNINTDSFSNTVLKDIKEIQIQDAIQCNDEEDPQWSSLDETEMNAKGMESNVYPTYFEYSMGGNLEFYKKYLQQADITTESRRIYVKNEEFGRPRYTSHSDNDSEPESLRYARRPQENTLSIACTITEDAELSFDYYSSIYQPEFMLNIDSKSLAVDLPIDNTMDEKSCEGKINNAKRRKGEPKLSEDFRKPSCTKQIDHFLSSDSVERPDKQQKIANQNISSQKDIDVSEYLSLENVKRKMDEKRHTCDLNSTQTSKDKNRSKASLIAQDCNKENFGKRITHIEKISVPNYMTKSPNRADSQTSTKAKQNVETTSEKKISSEKKTNFECDINLHKTADSSKVDSRMLSNCSLKNLNKKRSSRKEENNVGKQSKYLSVVSSKRVHDSMINRNEEMTQSSVKTIYKERKSVEATSKGLKSCGEQRGFYPESPISEITDFFQTPCSTRYSSLETFEMLENECNTVLPKTTGNQERTVHLSNTSTNYDKLPKEFQEIARRLSKKDCNKVSPSLHQLNNSHNFNCSSSTSSSISPHSPNGRKLFRTPSYKMPKTPSLSRHHPSTYVTQHTSSRSRSSSRMSSRATSPTREQLEAIL